jgi:hypothetical protein
MEITPQNKHGVFFGVHRFIGVFSTQTLQTSKHSYKRPITIIEKNMKILAIIILSLISLPILLSCEDKVSPATKAVGKVERYHINKQLKKHGFLCSSTGGGGDGKRIARLGIGFDTSESLTINTARKYFVQSFLEYLNDINQNESLKEHFTEWPFKGENLKYTLNVKVGDGVWPKFPNGRTPDNRISYVQINEGNIRYLIDVHRDKLPETIHSETLEEAIAILKAENGNTPSK